MVEVPKLLFDTNAIIEAVRVGGWNAITGGASVFTVSACCAEALAGDSTAGYVPVTKRDLGRLSAEYTVSDEERARFYLTYEHGDGMDEGERDRFAHALGRDTMDLRICSPDRASVRAALAVGVGNKLISLDEAMGLVGCKPRIQLQSHFKTRWLAARRTQILLGAR